MHDYYRHGISSTKVSEIVGVDKYVLSRLNDKNGFTITVSGGVACWPTDVYIRYSELARICCASQKEDYIATEIKKALVVQWP